jgi:hypothetical protein
MKKNGLLVSLVVSDEHNNNSEVPRGYLVLWHVHDPGLEARVPVQLNVYW